MMPPEDRGHGSAANARRAVVATDPVVLADEMLVGGAATTKEVSAVQLALRPFVIGIS
jgi:hypothetical protein